jgi:hypothetical protein
MTDAVESGLARRCQYCGSWFSPIKRTHRFCRDRCRVAYHNGRCHAPRGSVAGRVCARCGCAFVYTVATAPRLLCNDCR